MVRFIFIFSLSLLHATSPKGEFLISSERETQAIESALTESSSRKAEREKTYHLQGIIYLSPANWSVCINDHWISSNNPHFNNEAHILSAAHTHIVMKVENSEPFKVHMDEKITVQE